MIRNCLYGGDEGLHRTPLQFRLSHSCFLGFRPSPVLRWLLFSVLLLRQRSFPTVRSPLFLPRSLPPTLLSPTSFPFPTILRIPSSNFPSRGLRFPTYGQRFWSHRTQFSPIRSPAFLLVLSVTLQVLYLERFRRCYCPSRVRRFLSP